MKNFGFKTLLFLLITCILLGSLSMFAFAAEEDEDGAETETTQIQPDENSADNVSPEPAYPTESPVVEIVSAKIQDSEEGIAPKELIVVIRNKCEHSVSKLNIFLMPSEENEIQLNASNLYSDYYYSYYLATVSDLAPYKTATCVFPVDACSTEHPKIDCIIQYALSDYVYGGGENSQNNTGLVQFQDFLKEREQESKLQVILNFLKQTGFYLLAKNWKKIVMLLISFVLIYLAIKKKFEPLLLLPIAFGMLLTNLPGAEMFHEELFAEGHVHLDLFGAGNAGLVDYLYLGVKLGIYPCLIFLGIGAMTDFGPLIANPKSLLLGAAAQLGIFVTYLGANLLGFTPQEAGSIGIIGGADGPTAIFVTSKLAAHLLGPIAVAA